jgi:hypothetical protein
MKWSNSRHLVAKIHNLPKKFMPIFQISRIFLVNGVERTLQGPRDLLITYCTLPLFLVSPPLTQKNLPNQIS